MKTFTTTEISEHVDDLLSEVAAGRLSLVTKDEVPVFVAIPFTDDLLREGLAVSLAVKLFDEDVLSSRQGARIAGLSLSEFLSACSERGDPVVRYSAAEFEEEMKNLPPLTPRGTGLR